MAFRSLVLAVLLLLFSALLIVAVKAVGSMLTVPPPSFDGLDDCHLPCWRQIRPRSTPVEMADLALTAAGYQRIELFVRFRTIAYRHQFDSTACTVGLAYSGGIVTTLTLDRCSVRLGDLMAIIGPPDGILFNGRAVSFRDGRVIASLRGCGSFAPERSIVSIFLNNPGPPPPNTIIDNTPQDHIPRFLWRGFAPRAYYEAVEPNFPACT